jgi:hypothetical protein
MFTSLVTQNEQQAVAWFARKAEEAWPGRNVVAAVMGELEFFLAPLPSDRRLH